MFFLCTKKKEKKAKEYHSTITDLYDSISLAVAADTINICCMC